MMKKFHWGVTQSAEIDCSVPKLWKIISKESNLELFHPFCKKNKVIKWADSGSIDEIEYLNGKIFCRRFCGWINEVGYDLYINQIDKPSSFVSWRISEKESKSCITITVYPYLFNRGYEIINFYKEAFDIVRKNLSNIETSETQIYRHNSIDLNCSRHFRIFNEFNAIPKFCFDCFKVSVEAKTVLDLMKLYFVFDKLFPDQKYSRKLMIESRQDVSGNYKGFIYCSNVEEGENIQIKLKKILINNIGNDCSISLKRGCSEFSLKYPSYKKASKNKNEMMSYDKTWEQKEEIIDNKIYNSRSKKDKIYPSLNGYFLRDILVMRNWLIYAKEIGDNSYIEA